MKNIFLEIISKTMIVKIHGIIFIKVKAIKKIEITVRNL